MSYNKIKSKSRGGPGPRAVPADEVLTPKEQEEVAKLPKSTFHKFLSPAERKRRQRQKVEEAQRKKDEAAAREAEKRPAVQAQATPPRSPIPETKNEEEDAKSSASSELNEEEKKRAEEIAKTTFVSPMERKRRQLQKQKELAQKREEQANAAATRGGAPAGEEGGGAGGGGAGGDGAHSDPEASASLGANSGSATAFTLELQDRALRRTAAAAPSSDAAPSASPSPSPAPPVAPQDFAPCPIPPPESVLEDGLEAGGGQTVEEDPLLAEDRERQKRAAIQKVMKDATLDPVERNQVIQKIIKGDLPPGHTAPRTAATLPRVPPPAMAASAPAVLATEATGGQAGAGEEEEESKESKEAVAPPPSAVSPEERERQKRRAIQKVRNDSTLTLVERNAAIQRIIKGDFKASMKKEEVPQMDSSSESGEESGEESGGEEDSSSSGEYETDSEEGGDEDDDGEEWLSSSSYDSDASYETETTEEAIAREALEAAERAKKAAGTGKGTGELAIEGDLVVAAEAEAKTTTTAIEAAASTSQATAASVSTPEDTAQTEREKDLEAQLDQELQTHVVYEMVQQASLESEILAESQSEKESQLKLEAELDAELRKHTELELEQRERELEFQRRAFTNPRSPAAAQQDKEKARVVAEDFEVMRARQSQGGREQVLQHEEKCTTQVGEEEGSPRFTSSLSLEEEQERVLAAARALAQDKAECSAAKAVHEDKGQWSRFEDEQQHKLREEKLRLDAEERRLLLEAEKRRLQALREETEREKLHIAALREEQERQEEQQRILEQQRKLTEERAQEQQRLCVVREEREQQQKAIEDEMQRRQAEREREGREREQKRLEEERRLQEQRDLHQRLERERQQRVIEEQQTQVPARRPQQQQHRPAGQLRQREQQQVQEARAATARPQSSPTRGRASAALASRQGHLNAENSSSPSQSNRLTESRYTPYDGSSRSATSRQPPPLTRPNLRYDGLEDDELNWRLDSYASLSDYTIVVNRARPGPCAPDFDTSDLSSIEFVPANSAGGSPKADVYYVHKAMIAVGSRRSELLGRRIRETEVTSRGGTPDGHSSEVNVHETVMLEGAADAMGIVLDFCYYPERALDINVENAVPLMYLGRRYKIRALLEQAEAYVVENLESATAMYFLLDSYLYKLDNVCVRAIDVTAANLAETVDFVPIYRLPPILFRRIILSKDLKCDSELLSLIVIAYCGEHHAQEIDVEYFRELTSPRIMPDVDPKVAMMMLNFYVDLLVDDDENCEIMELLRGDSLMNRCVKVVAKHWQGEVCEPLMSDAEWDDPTAHASRRRPAHSEVAALHRALPPTLQNYILEKCILEAKSDIDTQKSTVENFEAKKKTEIESNAKNFAQIVKKLQGELEKSKKAHGKESQNYISQIQHLQQKAAELQAELVDKAKEVEEYKQELKRFRRVPGIHNFGEVAKDSAGVKIIDKTKCTFSANPDHQTNHRRGSRRPTQMPSKGIELDNLGKENGYLYDDGRGGLLPVFYYQKR